MNPNTRKKLKMTAPFSKEQITYTMIDALLPLKEKGAVRQKVFQILLSEGSKPNIATARRMIKDVFCDNRCEIDHEKIQTCIEVVQGLNNGLSRWVRSKNPDYKEQFPACELTKVMQKEETVNWIERWKNCGGEIYPGGRMIAPNEDSIWLKISDFGLPFPPFALNSGMGWVAVGYNEFLNLGGQFKNVNQPDVSTSKRNEFDEGIRQELLRALKSGKARYRVEVEIVKDDQQKKSHN